MVRFLTCDAMRCDVMAVAIESFRYDRLRGLFVFSLFAFGGLDLGAGRRGEMDVVR